MREKGIPEDVANKIYDEMIDFAKYAFNKSHAACYAYVAYMTAYLKTYFPVEFMAALMTSVLDNTSKISQYIAVCRDLNLEVLPPDINAGEGKFTVDNGQIRFGMCAIKSLGMPVVDAIVRERKANGEYTSLQEFLERLGNRVNKRAVENLIKAGALDCLPGNRRQKIMMFAPIMDSLSKDSKNTIEGQMSLLDFASEETKKALEIKLPDVEEFEKVMKLGFEKEVLGIYISGHPLEEDEGLMEKNVTAHSYDFYLDDETNKCTVTDGSDCVIGGMITSKTIKFTKKNQAMAFITLEDLFGSVEVIIFPRDYEKNRNLIEEDNRVFIKGRVQADEDKDAKLICSRMVSFSDVPLDIWIRFKNREEYELSVDELEAIPYDSHGRERIVIYLEEEKNRKIMPHFYSISNNSDWMKRLVEKHGQKNVIVVEKQIEFGRERV